MAGHTQALVLGADLEGLAAACTLAQGGRTVHVVDGAPNPGALASRIDLGAGYRAPGLATDAGLTRKALLAGLDLEASGLGWNPSAIPVHGLGPGADPYPGGTVRIEDLSASETRTWIRSLLPLTADLLDSPAPEVADPRPGDLLGLARLGLRLRSLGGRDLPELMRIATLPAWDWLDDVSSPIQAAGHIAPVLAGMLVGPRAAGTTALVLVDALARGPEPRGGLAGLRDALLQRAKDLGVNFSLGSPPAQIQIEAGRVRGLALSDGTELESALILSAIDPAATLLDLVDPRWIERAHERELLGWRRRGSCAVLLLGVRGMPDGPERFVTAESPVRLEQAADALKYGELPASPWLDVRVWRGPEHAPAATDATLTIHVHGVGRDLRGDESELRTTLRERALAELESRLPGIGSKIACDQLLLPIDLERDFGLAGGHLFRGELALDQLWITRPSMALSRYRTPIAGLFLGGAGSHPGGPFHCGAGILSARTALDG